MVRVVDRLRQLFQDTGQVEIGSVRTLIFPNGGKVDRYVAVICDGNDVIGTATAPDLSPFRGLAFDAIQWCHSITTPATRGATVGAEIDSIVGRAEHTNARCPVAERKNGVGVLEQYHGLPCGLKGQCAVFTTANHLISCGRVRVRVFEQPEFKLGLEYTSHRAVDDINGQSSLLHQPLLSITSVVGQEHVQTCFHRPDGGIARVGCDSMSAHEAGKATVVRDREALEPPFVAENICQEGLVAGAWHTIHAVVCRHNRA